MPKALGIRHFFNILFVGPCKLQTSFEFCSNNMEFVTLLSIMVIFLVALIIFRPLRYKFLPSTSIRTLKKLKLPPGKTGWPIIGESLEFLGTGRSGCPEKFIHDRMHTFSSQIFKTSLFCESIAVFCGPLGNKFLFSNENKLVTSWWPRSLYKIVPSQPVANSPEATRMRKMLVRFLNPETLHSFVGVMDSVAKNHLKTCWDNKSQVLVYPLAKSYTFSLAWKLFVSIDDPIQVAKLSDAFSVVLCGVISLPVDLPGTSLNKSIRAANFIRKHLHEIIKRRKIDLEENKASPTQDILSLMLLTCDDNGQFLTEADIVDKILVLILAGHDTASAAITFVIKYLAELPHIYNEVLKEQMEIMKSKAPGEVLLTSEDIKKMKYSWNVACEVMRHSPPVQGTFREAMTDFTYQGYTIPKGWKLYWSGNSTHKNANYFPDPSRFDPSRFEGNGPAPYTYVPFGGGPRMCPGLEYARLDILVFMHNVVTKFRWEKIYPDEKIVVDPLPIPAKGLPIQLQPHAC